MRYAALLACVLVAGCASQSPTTRPAAAATETPSVSVSPSPFVVVRPTPTEGPIQPVALWPTTVAPAVSCELAPRHGRVTDKGSTVVDRSGDTTIDGSFAQWLKVEAPRAEYVPLDGWVKDRGSDHWARFDYRVRGVPKASALFSADVHQSVVAWSWTVDACDPSEFAPGDRLSAGLRVWTDGAGKRVPLGNVLDGTVCGNPNGPRVLTLPRAGVFTRDPGGTFNGRLLASFAANVPVPSNATRTGYTQGGQKLWIAANGRAAYVGTSGTAERWPRLRRDDASVIDCN